MSSLTQIRASAGSGKTYALTQGYMKKLASVSPSESEAALAALAAKILAVTFTNAAANEMRERVLEGLKKIVLTGDEQTMPKALAKTWLEVFLKDLDALNIRTIDSLLHQIIRASSLDLGINPDYETEFDATGALQPYLELFLEKAAEAGPERELLRKASQVLINTQPTPPFSSGNRLLKRLEDSLQDTLTGKFAAALSPDQFDKLLKNAEEECAAAAAQALAAADCLRPGLQKSNREKIAAYSEGRPPEKPGALLGHKANPAKICAKNTVISNEFAKAFALFADKALFWHELRSILGHAREWHPFVELAREIGRIFETMQEADAILPQAMVPGLASSVLDPLEAVSDAFCKMGNRLTHFLVDEFQDTSDEQWAVLKALVHEAISRGGSFLWVGDPKQSIYGWRGGNPNLFDAAKNDHDLLAVEPTPETIRLAKNWRSRPAIVRHNNLFFKPLAQRDSAAKIIASMLSAQTDPAVIQAAASQAAEIFADVCQECHKDDAIPGYVDVLEITAAAAHELRESILTELASLLKEIGSRRPWSDVLILVRESSLAKAIAQKLGELDIPCLTENGLALNEHALINQTIAFLNFLNNPDDDPAFWTVLRGSLFQDLPGSDLPKKDEIAVLAANRAKESLRQAFQNEYPELWRIWFAPFFDMGSIFTPYDTVMELYSRLGMASRFPKDSTMLRRFMETLRLAENRGYATLADFLDYWHKRGDTEKAPMPANMDAARIMTIHKAKGLQAPVTIIPDTRFAIKTTKNPVPLDLHGTTIVTALHSDMGSFYQREAAAQALEALNLLYVAMTRAEEELYIFHTYTTGKYPQKTTSEAVASLLENITQNLAYPHGCKLNSAPGRSAKTPGSPEKQEMRAYPADPNWRPMQWLPRLKVFRGKADNTQLTANERGTLLHACLENLVPGERNAIDLAIMAAQRATGIIAPQNALGGIKNALEWFVSIPQASRWLQSLHKEQSIILADGSLARPDLIVKEKEGPLVIDYKSGQTAPEHIEQVQGYLEAIQSAGQYDGTPSGLIVYLDLKRFLPITMNGSLGLIENI